MEAPLNIALHQTKARQITWRVVHIVGAVLLAWTVVTVVYRCIFTWSDVVPAENAVHLRIPKTPRTQAHLRTLLNGIEVIPGVPWSADALLNASHRVLNISVQDQGIVTVVIDRAVSSEEQAAFEAFGAHVYRARGLTIVTNDANMPTVERGMFFGFLRTVFASHHATLNAGGNRFGVSLTETTATIHGFTLMSPPMIESTPTAHTILYASLSNELLPLSQHIFTQNTPGIANFFTLAGQNGLSATMHNAAGTLQYTFATPITEEARSLVNEASLRALAQELTEIPSIAGITEYLDDGSKTTTIRSRERAVVVLRDESPYRFLTATSATSTVTITETPKYLTVSNASAVTHTPTHPPCHSRAVAFIGPQAISTMLPGKTLHEPQTLERFLWRAATIAATSSATRICIVD